MRNWFRKRSDSDFRDEVESHLAHEAERQVRQQGVPEQDAPFVARRNFGNVLHAVETYHESSRWLWLERLGQHLRFAIRALVQRPSFSLTAIGSLGIGIGFVTAIFTIFYALSFRALPVRDASSLVNVYQRLGGQYNRGVHGVGSMVSYPEYQNYVAAIDSARVHGGSALTSATVYSPTDVSADVRGGTMHGEYVSCNYFSVVGVRMALGRGFTADECAHIGDPAVIVLSHDLWTREFAGDTSIVGRVVRVNQIPFTVVGVAEPGYGGLMILASSAWLPVTMEPVVDHGGDSIVVRDWSWMIMAARLAPGAHAREAQTQMAVAARQRDAQLYPRRQTTVYVTPAALFNFPEARERGAFVAILITLLGAVLVAMVCANIMNLLLARGIARRREIGIRLAIGASRTRLVEQLLIESLLIAVLGGAVGYALAHLLPPLLPKIVPVAGVQLNLAPDGHVLTLVLLVSVVTALVFGLIPALHATNIDLVSASRGAMTTRGRQMRTSRLRSAIVGVQVAGSGLLLIVSALFVHAAQRAASVDPGFITDNVVSFGLNLSQLGYSPARVNATYAMVRDRIASYPGVQGVGFAWPLPLVGRRSQPIDKPGDGPAAADGNDVQPHDVVSMASVSPSIFPTLGIRVVKGRSFTDADLAHGNPPAVVSQSLARRLAPTGDVIGTAFRTDGVTYTIVGIAADVRYTSLGDEDLAFAYLPADPNSTGNDRMDGGDRMRFLVRMSGSTAPLERVLPQWLHDIDPAIVVDPERMSARVDLELKPVRLSSMIAGAVGMLAMFLALVGIYGVVSYAVSQQTRDIAIRQALGATRRNVVQLVLRQGSRPVVIGIVSATVLALVVSQLIRKLLYGVSPLDPLAYFGVFALLMASAALAMYAPARRATRINPATALRED